ncbi:MAG: sulfite exporter TauE/SafE family protein [Gammaproteobacteria bacterium WSBS_2016_MAG_OTU1]
MMEFFISGLPMLACGFIIGFLICYSGVGGGALVIPAAILFFGMPPSIAIGTASIYAATTKIVAGVEHWRIGNVPWKLCGIFIVAAAPGVLLAAVPINYFSQQEGAEEIQTLLRYLVAAAIALSLIGGQLRTKEGVKVSRPLFVITAFFIGAMMGATGIGGGILIIPALFLLSDESAKRIVGASIIIALVLSSLAALIYAGGGQIDYVFAGWMLVGSLLAIAPASIALRRSSQTIVRKILNVLIVIALILMLWGEIN